MTNQEKSEAIALLFEFMDISIIIVNWNTKDLLQNCLESIYKTIHPSLLKGGQDFDPPFLKGGTGGFSSFVVSELSMGVSYEIIVVDNDSHDGSVTMLREEYPQVRIIQNKENKGFGAANNQAIRIMAGRYALLLNSDTVLKENAVEELFTFMESHPKAAMACGQLLNADGSKQNSIASFPSLLTLITNVPLLEYLFPKRYPSKRYHYDEPIEIDSGIGACLLVRKKAIDDVGMFDERYFFFFEETDWAYRMKKAGWQIFHIPTAFIYHLQGQSIGRDIRSRIEFYRSRYQFFRKWKNYPHYIVVSAIIAGRLFINWLLTSVATIVTLGMQKEIRYKWIVYSQLLLWHFHRNLS